MISGVPAPAPRSTPNGLSRDVGLCSDRTVDARSPESEPVEDLVNDAGTVRLPRAGDVIDGKFLVEGCIGSGGMAIVHRGEHLQLKSPVAIKLLRPELVTDGAAVSRFLREARLAASIENEHSTRIHDVGTTADGVPYIVMELMRGISLDAYLEREGPMSAAVAVSVVLQVLGVLAEAHAKGLVHRDLKPANLFMQERADGALWIKVMDFGISKLVTDSADSDPSLRITAPRSLLGSPQYMSPEQLRDSSSVDHRSDIWSVGIVLYELLTGGKLPFEASTLAELCALILDKDPEPLRRARGDVPPGLEEVMHRALAKDPSTRPQTVGELALLLAPYAPEAARASVGRIQATCLKASRARASTRAPLVVEGPRARPGKPLISSTAGILLVVAVGIVAYVAAPRLARERDARESAEVPTSRSQEVSPPLVASSPLPASPVLPPPSAPSATTAREPDSVAGTAPPPTSSVAVTPSVRVVRPTPASTRIRRPSEIKLVE